MYSIDDIKARYKDERVAIIGNGPSAMDEKGNYMDFSKEYRNIWVVNGSQVFHPTASLEFMMDDYLGPALKDAGKTRDVTDRHIKNSKIPIITTYAYEGFPALTEYPLFEIVDHHQTAYFGETLSYMVAFALWAGVSSIHFHGTDYMGCKPAERACTEFWCGIAKTSGVEIQVNPYSHLLSTQIDGINNHIPFFYGYIPATFPFNMTFGKDGLPNIRYGDKQRKEAVDDAAKKLMRETYDYEKESSSKNDSKDSNSEERST